MLPVLGALLVQAALVLQLELVDLALHRGVVAGEAGGAGFHQLSLDAGGDFAGIDVLAGLVLHVVHLHHRAALQNAGLGQGAGHRFGDHLQVGRTEFVGHGFNRLVSP
jgi:hypothetical protein